MNSEGIWKPIEVLVFGADAYAVGIATEPSAFIFVWQIMTDLTFRVEKFPASCKHDSSEGYKEYS